MIEGDNYPPTTIKYILAQTLSALKVLFIICIVSGTNPFPWFGLETPSFFANALDNKVS